MKKTIILIAAMLLFAVSAFSQIEGRVTDAKGNGVPKVTVTATGDDGKVAGTVTTDEDGKYSFEELAPGKYHITAKGPAVFQSFIRENVNVAEDQTTTLDIQLASAAPTPAPNVRPPVKTDETLIDLAKAALAAHGGDKFIRLQTLVIRGGADVSPPNTTQSIPATFAIVISGGRYLFEIQSILFNFKQIYDGQKSYSSMAGFGMPLDRMGLEMLRKINEKGYTASALPEKFKRKKGFRITSPEGSYTDFIVDEKTNRVKEFESSYALNGNTLMTSAAIDKYREVEGVFIAEKFAQRMEMPQGEIYVSFAAKEILVNSEIANDIFAMPK